MREIADLRPTGLDETTDSSHLSADVERATTEHLEEEARHLASAIAAVTCRWLLVLAELDRREAWRSWGCRGMTQWLSWRCGVAPVTARQHLEVARRLADLALVRERFAAGTLSFSKVRALCRHATAATETELVDLADSASAAQLETLLRAYARAVEVRSQADLTAAAHRGRRLRIGSPSDRDTVTIRIDATPEAAAALRARLREFERTVPDECVADADDPAGARRHDAFLRLVEGPDAPRLVVNLHADLADLAAPHDASDAGVARPVAPAVARLLARIGDDARVRLLIEDHGRTIDLGRTSRDPSRPLRRYVLQRDHHRCRFPGCERRAEHLHHVRPWIVGGPTDRANLASMCRYHHRLLHDGGWWATGDAQTVNGLRFHSPDNARQLDASPAVLPRVGDLDPVIAQIAPDAHLGLRHCGGRLDLDHTVLVLAALLAPSRSTRHPSAACRQPRRPVAIGAAPSG